MEMKHLKVRNGALLEAPVPDAMGMTLISIGSGSSVQCRRPDTSLWVVVRGQARVSCQRGEVELAAGEWIQLERDDRAAVRCSAGGLVLGVVLGGLLQVRQSNSLHAALMPGFGRVGRDRLRDLLRQWRLILRVLPAAAQHPASSSWQAQQLLQCLANLQHGHQTLVDRCPGRSLRRRRLVFCRLQKACTHQRLNLDQAVPVTVLAEMACMSLWYFIRTYNAVYGKCPQAMATDMRLQRAASLLRSTALSIAEVGAATGFENNCSFSRAFRNHYGLPPSLYRLQQDSQSATTANIHIHDGQARLAQAV